MQGKIRFYGTSAATPSLKRGFACIGLIRGQSVTLFDCGDGSIGRILSLGTDVSSISKIFVTHYHSDHLSGIVQVIETMGIRKRKADLEVYGPKGLLDYFSTIEKITRVAATRQFKIKLHELEPGSKLRFGDYSISAYEMVHTVPCIGYKATIGGYTMAYTGDTEPCDESLELARNCDTLIHEATYLKKDTELARRSKHSTPSEAAETAKAAGAKNLILTHVNDDYETESEMLSEAKIVHEHTHVARDGLEIELDD